MMRTPLALSRALCGLGGLAAGLAAFTGVHAALPGALGLDPSAAGAPRSPIAAAAPAASPGMVGRSGTRFVLDGQPYRFVGANLYNAAADRAVYECGPWMEYPEAELEDWFRRARVDYEGRVIRFWAFQKYTNGGTDWRGMDRVFAYANAHGLKVIPVLENQWEECTEGGYKHDSWYASGYLEPYGAYSLSYKEYVRRVVTRYKDEPAVAAWMLMNEAESKSPDGRPNPDALYRFTRDMSAYVKGLDSNHLLTLGVMGSGQPGADGDHYVRLHDLQTIDFLDYHDYGRNDEPIPGDAPVLVAPLLAEFFTQDAQWQWTDLGWRQTRARDWETMSAAIGPGGRPFQRVGIHLLGDHTGDVLIDQIQVGARVYDFEDGTTQGWQAGSSLAIGNAVTADGRRVLRVTRQAPGAAQLWIPATPDDGPGTTLEARMYVDVAGSPREPNTLAAALHTAKVLDKPVVVSEAGMLTCGPVPGWQTETVESRAQKMDAKLDAFFDRGGAGYLLWTWHPSDSCHHNFTTGDPLNEVAKESSVKVQVEPAPPIP